MDREKQLAFQIAFGQRVREARKEKKLTQVQLAVKAETDARQIQRIEAGEIATSVYQAYLISVVLEVGMDELM